MCHSVNTVQTAGSRGLTSVGITMETIAMVNAQGLGLSGLLFQDTNTAGLNPHWLQETAARFGGGKPGMGWLHHPHQYNHASEMGCSLSFLLRTFPGHQSID